VNGLVSTHLDFGPGVFDGAGLVLETRTRKGDQTGAFEVQTPRLPISPVPYAIYAYDGPFWMLGGNSGTTADSNFVGTTDAQPLVFKVNDSEAMRIGPTGNVGIGTDAPVVALHVVKESGGEVTQYIGPGDSGGRLKLAYLVGERVGRVTAHGNGAAQQLQLEGSTIVLNTDDGTGSVGIGTLNPCEGDGSANCLLHVSKSGANRIRIDASSGQQAGLDLRSGNSREIITYDTETGVKFWNGDRGVTDLFIRNSDGFVGINTGSSTNAPLEVHGENANGYGAIFTNISTNGKGVLIQATDGNGTVPIFRVEDNSKNVKLVVREDGNVGIGTDNPSEKLSVAGVIQSTSGGFKFPDGTVQASAASGGSAQQVCVISGNDCDFGSQNIITKGRVGIGTEESPFFKLAIESTLGGGLSSAIESGANGVAGQFVVKSGGSGQALLAETTGNGIAASIAIRNPSNPNDALNLSTNGTGRALFAVGESLFLGDVSIGDAPRSHNLTVNGTITSKEVIVKTSVFPDYVFDDDYDLMSLPDLEQTIRQEGHLPGMPSAEEVAKSGIGLGDMQTRLLEKIEELTLHTIEQDKQIQKLQAQLAPIGESNRNNHAEGRIGYLSIGNVATMAIASLAVFVAGMSFIRRKQA
jgi:hypothetical protein